MKPFLIAPLAVGLLLSASFASAQAPEPKLPATPSMDQKGADDMSKPAGAERPAPPPAAPKAPPKPEAKAPPPAAKHGAAAKAPPAKIPPAKPHTSRAPRAKNGHAPTRVPRKRK